MDSLILSPRNGTFGLPFFAHFALTTYVKHVTARCPMKTPFLSHVQWWHLIYGETVAAMPTISDEHRRTAHPIIECSGLLQGRPGAGRKSRYGEINAPSTPLFPG